MARRARMAIMAIAIPTMAPVEIVKVLDEVLFEGLLLVPVTLGG